MANMISKRAGAFVAVVLIITGVMFLAFGNLEQDYDASSDPAVPAFLSLTVPKDTGEGNADASSTAKQTEE